MHKLKYLTISIILLLVLSLAGPSFDVAAAPLAAATQVNLGTAAGFAVLAGSGITNTGATTITGDVGSHPTTTQTGFGTVTLNGTNHFGDGVTQGAKTDLTAAYTNAAGQGTDFSIVADLGGQTLTPGVHTSGSSIGLTGTVILDGGGDPNAVFIFQAPSSTLTTASASVVSLINGTQACNVFWQVGSSATLGTTSNFAGTIMALESITDNGGSTVNGRFLARNAAVTLNNTTITRPLCQPIVTTNLSSGSITIGGTVNDSATLSGDTSTSGGTVTYTVYTDAACTLNPQTAGTVTVTNGVVPNSNTITFNSAGTFYWQAVYSGDSNNNGAASACTTEQLTVNKATPAIETTLSSSSVNVNSTVYDSAILTGATANAGGTVTYTVYTDNVCTSNAQTAGTKSVTSGIVQDSDPITFNTDGTYYWQAVYSGDTNNNGAASACTSEVLLVNNPAKNTPTIATTLSSSSVTVGSTVYDSAILTGATTSAGGTVTYTVFTNNVCTLNAQTAGTKTVTSGVVQDSDPITFNTAGTYFWRAVYGGDTNNNGAISVCTSEELTVTTVGGVPPPVVPPSEEEEKSSFSVGGLPNAGGAPIREEFPWNLVIVAGLSAIALGLGVRAFRRTHLPKQ